MTEAELNESLKAEADYFDNIVDKRTARGLIPIEADYRRATKFIPKCGDKFHIIDPKMTSILAGNTIETYIGMVSHRPGGRVLDLGCGSGWLALEFGRRGQYVDAYDISPKAIKLAKQMLLENPYQEGFGEVNYYLKDISEVDLGEEKYDAISGWSAFHHIPNFSAFMERVKRALKPGGILATMDDMHQSSIEKWFEHFFEFILPLRNFTYIQKFSIAYQLLVGKKKLPAEFLTPMEEAKHSSVSDIEKIWKEQYELLVRIQQNAFVGTPVMRLRGPDSFRYGVARLLVGLDRLLCKVGVVKGFERIMISRKRM